MNWATDTSPPRVTPAHVLDLYCAGRGISRAEAELPSVLLGTFQPAAHQRLLLRTGAPAPADGADGPVMTREVAVGEVAGLKVGVVRLGVGAPATALSLELAIARGARHILVVGSAGSLQPTLPLGSVVVVTGAEREDGTSHHYLPLGEVVSADRDLAELLEAAARERGLRPVRGRSWTTDAPYRETEAHIHRHREAGVLVVEMEAAAIFAVAQVRGVRAGVIVAVSDELFLPWNPGFHQPAYREALTEAAEATLAAASRLA